MEVAVGVAAYTTCSALAIVVNKLTMSRLPVPGFVFVLQLFSTVAYIQGGRALGLLKADALDWQSIKVFVPYICSFVLSLYSNGRALAASNIETVIVFRSLSPLCVSVLDWVFLGRQLPSPRNALVLLGVVAGAVGYVMTDSQFKVAGLGAYKWVTLNLCGIVFEMTYGKRLISGIQFTSPVWGAVLYTNTLALPPMLMMALSTGEQYKVQTLELSDPVGLVWLLSSCVIGVGISWAGWNCRSKITATAYTLLGVVCKFISVILNVLIWDKHATNTGLCMLMITMVCSSFYRQAPLRSPHDPATANDGLPAWKEEAKEELEEVELVADIDGQPNGLRAKPDAEVVGRPAGSNAPI